MNDNNLTTTSASGSQSTTENPQTAGATNGLGTPAASVQPGTATTVLDARTGGVPLTNKSLPTISLPSATATVAQPATPPQRSNSPVVTGVSILLFLVALAIVAAVLLPAKNTTD